MRMLLSKRWPISAKKIVSPFQTPMKNPGAPEASDIGWWAHDNNNKMDANSAAVQICLGGFIVSLAIEVCGALRGACSSFCFFPGLRPGLLSVVPPGLFLWFNTI